MKVHRLAVGRVFLLAALLAPLPTPVASQADSTTEGQRKGDVHTIIIFPPDRVPLYVQHATQIPHRRARRSRPHHYQNRGLVSGM